MSVREFNFDGLVGPTHNYSGLSFGNLASKENRGEVANPRAAALQGLAKMHALAGRGFAQGVLPPHERPDIAALRRLGFTGTEPQVIERAAREAPALFAACASASAMWTANAATVSPAADTADGRVHFTPANLNNKLHRAMEPETTARILRAVFPEGPRFAHHDPLPSSPQLGDEGAANHTRLIAAPGEGGVALFVFGASGFDAGLPRPQRFPARQTLEASQAIARQHGLDSQRVVFAQQDPRAIDAGAFHNDVISVGHQDVLFVHEQAFLEPAKTKSELQRALAGRLRWIEVPTAQVSLEEAVATYLFNSQLLSQPDGSMLLVVPEECRATPRVWEYLQRLVASAGPVRELLAFDLRESMRNGGGPACLRLRVTLEEADRAALNPAVVLDAALHERLAAWVHRHYRDRLAAPDLADPLLLDECRTALDELSGILALGSVYPFQRDG